jgi:hypothetical protein
MIPSHFALIEPINAMLTIRAIPDSEMVSPTKIRACVEGSVDAILCRTVWNV